MVHKFVCKEAAFPSPAYEKELEEVYAQYVNFTNNVVEQGRWEGREDFTVVLQPMFEEFKVPYKTSGEPDLSYFAPDCFHLSAKGHSMLLFVDTGIKESVYLFCNMFCF